MLTQDQKRRTYNAARRVRRWADKMATRLTDDVYINRRDLKGMCGIASYRLAEELEKEGVPHKICYIYQHAFVIAEDHVVDVTATQFGKGKVVFRKDPKGGVWENEDREFFSKDEFKEWQVEAGWHEEHQVVHFSEKVGW